MTSPEPPLIGAYGSNLAESFTLFVAVPDLSHAAGISSLGIAGIAVVTVMFLGIALLAALMWRKQRALLDQLFQQAPRAVAAIDADNRVVRVNRGFTHLFGYTPQEARGRRLDELIVPDESRDEDQAHVQLVGRGERVEAEGIRQRKGGDRVHVSVVHIPASMPDGQVAAYAIYHDISERKRSEERIHFQASLLDQVRNAVIATDIEYKVTFWNRFAETLYQWKSEEVLGRNALDLIVPDEGRRTAEAMIESMKATGHWEGECVVRRKDGSTFPIYSHNATIGGTRGEVIGFVGITTDITERKRSEERIHFKASLLNQVRNAVIATDLEYKVTWWNHFAETLYQWKSEEVLGRNVLDLIVPDESRSTGEAILESMKTTGYWEGEFVVRRKDGSTFPAYAYDATIRGTLGDVIGFVSTSTDITERKRAEEALRQAQARTESVLSSVADTHILFDRDWRYLYVNEAAARALGRSREQILGRTLWELYPDIVHTELDRQYHRAMDERLPVAFDFHYLTTDLWWENRFHPVPEGLAVFATDITERKRAEAERERYAAQLQELAHAAAGINSVASVDEVVRVATEKARTIVGARHAIVGIRQAITGLAADERAAQTVQTISLSDNSASYRSFEVQPDGTGTYALVCERNQPLRMTQADLEAHPRRHPFGQPAGEDPPMGGWLAAPLIGRDRRNLGLIQLSGKHAGDFTAADEAILVQLAQMASVAIENARLFAQIEAARERLQSLSRQLVEAQEEERRRIARELHDEIGQALTALKFNLQSVRRTAGAALPALDESIDIAERVLQQVRDLSLDLRPSLLDDLGLSAALRWYLDRQAQRTGWKTRFTSDHLDLRLPTHLETVCFRVTQEALTNVARHARATRVWLDVRRRIGQLLLTILDDGVGFDVDAALRHALGGRSFGVLGMQERVALAGGWLNIRSTPGGGTEIRVGLPITAAATTCSIAGPEDSS